MILPLSIHLATLVAPVIKTTCKSHTLRLVDAPHVGRGRASLPPRDFCLKSRRTSWTSGTRLTELIISQAGCGLGRNVPKFLTLITSPLHSPRAANFRRSRSRSLLFIGVASVWWLLPGFNSRIKNVLNVRGGVVTEVLIIYFTSSLTIR